MAMTPVPAKPVVHLELHTDDLPRACAFYAELCGWRPERLDVGRSTYWALGLLGRFGGGGVVECDTTEPLWLPYVEVSDIGAVTERAAELGASVSLEPREGPLGWRSVVSAPAAGEVAFWQPKARGRRSRSRRAVSIGDR
jgi:predicted enzyme related to lactoylglutathione lyase